jgi:hypothetical protein
MSLTKRHEVVFFPGSPATPEVPFQPEYTNCYSQPAPGYWETQQQAAIYKLSDFQNGGISLPPDAVVTYFENEEGDFYIAVTWLVSVWVTTGPPGPPICTTYPEIPFQPAMPSVPPRIEYRPNIGWNAGANSVVMLEGDVSLRWTDQITSVGAVIGLTTDREANPEPTRMSHAIYFFQTAGGQPRWCVYENGVAKTPPTVHSTTDTWEIRRVGSLVGYFRNDARVYLSTSLSVGEVSTGSSLYAAMDSIGGA